MYRFMIAIFFVVILFFLLSYLYKRYSIDNNTTDVEFLRAEETEDFIMKDKDFYIHNMSEHDVKARYASSSSDYIMKSAKDACNVKNKSKIIDCCKEADVFFSTLDTIYLPDNHNIDKMQWRIGSTKGYYEQGYPHTRSNIIFITPAVEDYDERRLIKLMIHEKIHVYQRYNRDKIGQILKKLGYNKIENKYLNVLARSNPDIDEFIYTDPSNKKMICEYNSDNPANLNDVTIQTEYEHPYEEICYKIQELF